MRDGYSRVGRSGDTCRNSRNDFERDVREWKIGDQIDVDPLDCQSIAISFSLLANQLQADFEHEMNGLLIYSGLWVGC